MKGNQRVIITKKILKDTLLQLLKKKDIDHISVKELCETAGINRSTFYRHYDSQYDLLEEIINHYANILIECNEAIAKDAKQSMVSIRSIMEYFYTHREENDLFMQNPDLLSKVFSKVKPFYTDNMNMALRSVQYSEKEKEYMYAFVREGIVAIQKEWMLSGMRESPDEISALILKVSEKCL